MAGFRTHIATSTAIGAAYGFAGHIHWGIDPATCMVAAGLCGVAGILPDVDSETGHAHRELLTFLAAVTPMLMIDRFAHLGLTYEQMVLAGGCLYILVRFGLGELLGRYTVHRGMWHSIPAAAIAGLIASLLCSCEDTSLRLFKVAAVVIGYLTHLILDELWAIEWYRGRLRLKNSFGTALKLFGRSSWPNISTYGKLILICGLAYSDPMIMQYFGAHPGDRHQYAREWVERVIDEEHHVTGHEHDDGVMH